MQALKRGAGVHNDFPEEVVSREGLLERSTASLEDGEGARVGRWGGSLFWAAGLDLDLHI